MSTIRSVSAIPTFFDAGGSSPGLQEVAPVQSPMSLSIPDVPIVPQPQTSQALTSTPVVTVAVPDQQVIAAAAQNGQSSGTSFIQTALSVGRDIFNMVDDVIDIPKTLENVISSAYGASQKIASTYITPQILPTAMGMYRSLNPTNTVLMLPPPPGTRGWQPLGNSVMHATNGNIMFSRVLLSQAIELVRETTMSFCSDRRFAHLRELGLHPSALAYCVFLDRRLADVDVSWLVRGLGLRGSSMFTVIREFIQHIPMLFTYNGLALMVQLVTDGMQSGIGFGAMPDVVNVSFNNIGDFYIDTSHPLWPDFTATNVFAAPKGHALMPSGELLRKVSTFTGETLTHLLASEEILVNLVGRISCSFGNLDDPEHLKETIFRVTSDVLQPYFLAGKSLPRAVLYMEDLIPGDTLRRVLIKNTNVQTLAEYKYTHASGVDMRVETLREAARCSRELTAPAYVVHSQAQTTYPISTGTPACTPFYSFQASGPAQQQHHCVAEQVPTSTVPQTHTAHQPTGRVPQPQPSRQPNAASFGQVSTNTQPVFQDSSTSSSRAHFVFVEFQGLLDRAKGNSKEAFSLTNLAVDVSYSHDQTFAGRAMLIKYRMFMLSSPSYSLLDVTVMLDVEVPNVKLADIKIEGILVDRGFIDLSHQLVVRAGKLPKENVFDVFMKQATASTVTMTTMFSGATGYDEVLAALRNRLMHALNGNVEQVVAIANAIAKTPILMGEIMDLSQRRKQIVETIKKSSIVYSPSYYGVEQGRQLLGDGEMAFVPYFSGQPVNQAAGGFAWNVPISDIARRSFGPGINFVASEIPESITSLFMLQPTAALGSLARSNNRTISMTMMTDALTFLRASLSLNSPGIATWQWVARLESVVQSLAPIDTMVYEKNASPAALDPMGAAIAGVDVFPNLTVQPPGPAPNQWYPSAWPHFSVPGVHPAQRDVGIDHTRVATRIVACTAGDYWAYMNGTLGNVVNATAGSALLNNIDLRYVMFIPYRASEATDGNALIMKMMSNPALPWPFAPVMYQTLVTHYPLDPGNTFTGATPIQLVSAPSTYAWVPTECKIEVVQPGGPPPAAPVLLALTFCLVDIENRVVGGNPGGIYFDQATTFNGDGVPANQIANSPLALHKMWARAGPGVVGDSPITYEGAVAGGFTFFGRWEQGAPNKLPPSEVELATQMAIQSLVSFGFVDEKDLSAMSRLRAVTSAKFLPNPTVAVIPRAGDTGFGRWFCHHFTVSTPAAATFDMYTSPEGATAVSPGIEADIPNFGIAEVDFLMSTMTDCMGVRSTRTIDRATNTMPRTAGPPAYYVPAEADLAYMSLATGVYTRALNAAGAIPIGQLAQNPSGNVVKSSVSWTVDRTDSLSVSSLLQARWIAAAVDLNFQMMGASLYDAIFMITRGGIRPMLTLYPMIEPILNGLVFGANAQIMYSMAANQRPDPVVNGYFALLAVPVREAYYDCPMSRTTVDDVMLGKLGVDLKYAPLATTLASETKVVASVDVAPAVGVRDRLVYELQKNPNLKQAMTTQPKLTWMIGSLNVDYFNPNVVGPGGAAVPELRFYRTLGHGGLKKGIPAPYIAPDLWLKTTFKWGDVLPPTSNAMFTNGFNAIWYFNAPTTMDAVPVNTTYFASGITGVVTPAKLGPPEFRLPAGQYPDDLSEFRNSALVTVQSLIGSIYGSPTAALAQEDAGAADTKNE